MIAVLIKSTASLLIIYVLYMIFMAKENAPVFKRYYLIFGILFSYVISCVEISLPTISTEIRVPMIVNNQIAEIDAAGFSAFSSHSNTLEIVQQMVVVVYLSVFLLLAFRYILNLSRLIKSGRTAKQLNGYKVALLQGDASPYSFFNTIYISEKDYNNGDISKEILFHELVHIKQKHSIDILFVEFLQVVFWFNPLLYLLKREIKLNHEYLADVGVVSSDIAISDYQKSMINSVFRNNSSCLASNFNYSFIKKRIIMLKKEKSPVRLFLKGITIFPFILLVAIAFAFSSNGMPIGTSKWWEPILKKHNLEIVGYNNFGDVFEMGDTNTIVDGVSNLTNATMIVKGKSGDYLIIQANSIEHNIKTGALKIELGVFKRYSDIDADVSKPQVSGGGTMEINLNDRSEIIPVSNTINLFQ